ncbi:hypothetical protein [Lactococcus allomyrinae]|uniref:hypothetical protein n=1 Tax=Lactococcus allomyrinae TaxID=2419773 RepID=UPI0013C496EF|nr:hypothetical protein [Lactococcus allomyrinae]
MKVENSEGTIFGPPCVCGTLSKAEKYKRNFEKEGFIATIYKIELVPVESEG